MGRQTAARAPVAADDQPTSRSDHEREEPVDELAPPLLGRVDELRADEVEAPRRLPPEGVADEEAVGPLRKARPCEFDEPRREVETVRLDRMRRPADERLEQIPVRASDVEEGPRAVDRADDRPPRCLPASLVAAGAGLAPRIVAREVVLLVDLAREPGRSQPRVLLSLTPGLGEPKLVTTRPGCLVFDSASPRASCALAYASPRHRRGRRRPSRTRIGGQAPRRP